MLFLRQQIHSIIVPCGKPPVIFSCNPDRTVCDSYAAGIIFQRSLKEQFAGRRIPQGRRLFLVAGCGNKKSNSPVVAKGDGFTITADDFKARIEEQAPFMRARYTTLDKKKEFLENNLVRFADVLRAHPRGADIGARLQLPADLERKDPADTLVRTRGQMSAVMAVSATALSMLGGAYWPLDIVSPAMRTVAYLTPTGWAMQGLTDIVVRAQGPGQAVLPALVLTGMSALFLAVGISRLRLE